MFLDIFKIKKIQKLKKRTMWNAIRFSHHVKLASLQVLCPSKSIKSKRNNPRTEAPYATTLGTSSIYLAFSGKMLTNLG